MQNTPAENLETKRFRLDATLNVAHILTTIALLFQLFQWGGSVETRLAAVQMDSTNNKIFREEQARQVQQAMADMRQDLRGMNDKMDRLIERRVQQ